MEIPKNVRDEIWEYCRINNITNVDEFMVKMIKQGFTIEKFGATPTIQERIVEKIIEVPVEKIIEVPIETLSLEQSDNMKNQQLMLEESQRKMREAMDISDILRKQLEEEKQKNKKDLYGER